MELIDAIATRRSIRNFKEDPVPDSHIRAILDAGRMAPSGVNLQPWRFIVVKSQEARKRLAEGTPMGFVPKAPVVIICCVDTQAYNGVGQRITELKEAGAFLGTPLANLTPEEYLKRRTQNRVAAKAYLGLNAAIAIDHMTLRAVDLGLGTCWVMLFDQEKIKQAVDLEERYNVVALLPVGYPEHIPGPRPRLPLESLILKEL